MLFDGFNLEQVTLGSGRLRLRRGGSGPPLLLLHGNPQTHAMWHRVAPQLAGADGYPLQVESIEEQSNPSPEGYGAGVPSTCRMVSTTMFLL